MAPSLSIVMTVFNEPYWIGVSVADAVHAVENSSFSDPELIIVEDGSGEETQAAVQQLRVPFPLRVIRQDRNRGIFLARQLGVEAARGDLVLQLDARVFLQPDGLRFVSERSGSNGLLPVWCGYTQIRLGGNLYARFWNVLTEVAYRDFCENPRTMSYGIEEYDHYPKGGGCLLAPREALLDAIDNFDSCFSDSRNASDDTKLIRFLAARQPINISPRFASEYQSRDRLVPFLRHAFHRGPHLIDGWLRVGGRFFGVIIAFYPLSALAVLAALRRPRAACAVLLATPIAGAGAGVALKRSPADCGSLALLGVPWLFAYAAGLWRGLWLAGRAQAARRVRSATQAA